MPIPQMPSDCHGSAFDALPAHLKLERLRAERDRIERVLSVVVTPDFFSAGAKRWRERRTAEMEETVRILNRNIETLNNGQASRASRASPPPEKSLAIAPSNAQQSEPLSILVQSSFKGKTPLQPLLKNAGLASMASSGALVKAAAAAAAAKDRAAKHTTSNTDSTSDTDIGSSIQASTSVTRLNATLALANDGNGDDETFEHIDHSETEDFEYLDEDEECDGFDDCGGSFDSIAEQYGRSRPAAEAKVVGRK